VENIAYHDDANFQNSKETTEWETSDLATISLVILLLKVTILVEVTLLQLRLVMPPEELLGLSFQEGHHAPN
jgi:hypothetical protein